MDVPNDGRADVFGIADALGIKINASATEPDNFDGLAIWGNSYGPGVFLNSASVRAVPHDGVDFVDEPAVRVTLAHELCHLLLDGRHALSAIEILNARMPAGVEARAKSFAGEFLLPTEVAALVWLGAKRPTDKEGVNSIVEELSKTYCVTRSVAAWKLQHGAELHAVDLDKILNIVVPQR